MLPTFTRRFGMHWWALQVPVPLIEFGAAALGAWLLARGGTEARAQWLGRAGALALGVAAFFALELSYPVWRLNTPLNLIQFPFRLTTIAAVLVPMLAAPVLMRARGLWRLAAMAALAANALLGCVFVLQLSTQGRHLPFATDQLVPYKGLPEYRILTRGPDWKAYVDSGSIAGECRRLGIACSKTMRDGAGYRWRVVSQLPVVLRLPVFDFPAFVTTLDGHDTPDTRDAATGLIAVALAPGAHELFAHWRPLPIQRDGEIVSLVSAAGMIGAIAATRRRREHGRARAAEVTA